MVMHYAALEVAGSSSYLPHPFDLWIRPVVSPGRSLGGFVDCVRIWLDSLTVDEVRPFFMQPDGL